jgi:hypothetical protein
MSYLAVPQLFQSLVTVHRVHSELRSQQLSLRQAAQSTLSANDH